MNIGLILAQMLASLGMKLLTEKFIVNTFLIVAGELAKKTNNTLDDRLINQLDQALNK